MNIRDIVFSGNLEALTTLLNDHPELANADFSLPDNPANVTAFFAGIIPRKRDWN